MTITELAQEYNRIKDIIYGISVADYLLLHEQSLKEGGISPARSFAPVVEPALAPIPVAQKQEAAKPTIIAEPPTTQTRTKTPMSDLDILRGLGE